MTAGVTSIPKELRSSCRSSMRPAVSRKAWPPCELAISTGISTSPASWSSIPQFDVAGDFHDGKAVVSSAGRYGYVDKNAKFVIQPQFNAAGDFNDGLALVGVGPRFGFIGTDGKFEINPQFEKAGTFQDGLGAGLAGRQRGLHRQARQVRLESRPRKFLLAAG